MISEQPADGTGPRPRMTAGDDLRASDAERQAVVDALRRHTGDGRLQLDEFEERSSQAFAARTRRDLNGLLVDLPELAGAGRAPGWSGPLPATVTPTSSGGRHDSHRDAPTRSGSPSAAHHHRGSWAGRWTVFLYVAALLTAIWAMTGLSGGGLQAFWPMWVIVPWGLSIAFSGGAAGCRRSRAVPPGGS